MAKNCTALGVSNRVCVIDLRVMQGACLQKARAYSTWNFDMNMRSGVSQRVMHQLARVEACY